MPAYKNASYGGETITLDNGLIRLNMHKRLCGWGWGEIYSPSGKLMAVIDHLGEMMVRDQEIPMRMEAGAVRREKTAEGESLIFDVEATVVQDKLKGTSFDGWIHYAFGESCMAGTVTLTMPCDQPRISMKMRLHSKINGYARYIRGPWLKVGQDSFGVKKDDAMLPGVEWLVGDEWSSGTDWFKDPWAMRVCPHPNKVTAPVMALSEGGDVISLCWNPNQMATGWFNYRRHNPQPVLAAPNFIDRQNNSIMGLMIPAASDDFHENEVLATHPLELHLDQMVNFDADIVLGRGDSLSALVDWVKRKGLPAPGFDMRQMEQRLHEIARAYNERFFFEGRGFGITQHPKDIRPVAPQFARAYVEAYPEHPEAKALRDKLDWCEAQGGRAGGTHLTGRVEKTHGDLLARAKEVLSWQHEDGSFSFDPDGRHYTKDDFVVARSFIEPMGVSGDSALDIVMLPVMELMDLGQKLPDDSLLAAARKGLDYCLKMTRPEAGDFWECPLHSPNLLASGHAANIYETAYRLFGDEAYHKAAVHWIRGLLAFTQLWNCKEVDMLYNTKPCLCSSDWYFANWVRDHVQWEVLAVFNQADALDIDWAQADPEIDWFTFRAGITSAAMRWQIDHTRQNWLPHNMPWTYDDYAAGRFDGCFPDTHNSVSGNYGGMMIMPDPIAVNIQGLLKRKK